MEQQQESIFGDEFSFDDVIVSVVDETSHKDIDPNAYVESLSSRVSKILRATKGFHDLVEIAEAYDDDAKVNIRLKTTTVAPAQTLEDIISQMDIKDTKKVKTPFGEFVVPIPTESAIYVFNKTLTELAIASLKTIKDVSILRQPNTVDLAEMTKRIQTIAKQSVSQLSKSSDRQAILTSILTIMMVDKCKEEQIAAINNAYSKTEMWVDPITSGLWVVAPENGHMSIGAARSRTVRSVYDFDDNQCQNLKNIVFAIKPRVVAAAKLNLYSRLKPNIKDEVTANPSKVLADALSEAQLTQEEVKAVIFATPKEGQSICPVCNDSVDVDGITYHRKCKVIDWLTDYFFFKYDEELQVLSTQKLVYLDRSQRAMLEAIRKHHKTLNSPFKVKGGAKYQTMVRAKEQMSTLTNISTDPRNVPGTSEWIRQMQQDAARSKKH